MIRGVAGRHRCGPARLRVAEPRHASAHASFGGERGREGVSLVEVAEKGVSVR